MVNKRAREHKNFSWKDCLRQGETQSILVWISKIAYKQIIYFPKGQASEVGEGLSGKNWSLALLGAFESEMPCMRL